MSLRVKLHIQAYEIKRLQSSPQSLNPLRNFALSRVCIPSFKFRTHFISTTNVPAKPRADPYLREVFHQIELGPRLTLDTWSQKGFMFLLGTDSLTPKMRLQPNTPNQTVVSAGIPEGEDRHSAGKRQTMMPSRVMSFSRSPINPRSTCYSKVRASFSHFTKAFLAQRTSHASKKNTHRITHASRGAAGLMSKTKHICCPDETPKWL